MQSKRNLPWQVRSKYFKCLVNLEILSHDSIVLVLLVQTDLSEKIPFVNIVVLIVVSLSQKFAICGLSLEIDVSANKFL